jgi:hypothetical protein
VSVDLKPSHPFDDDTLPSDPPERGGDLLVDVVEVWVWHKPTNPEGTNQFPTIHPPCRRAGLFAFWRKLTVKLKLKPHRDSRSGVRGVDWCRSRHKWRSRICVNGCQRHLGYYELISDASAAYVAARRA